MAQNTFQQYVVTKCIARACWQKSEQWVPEYIYAFMYDALANTMRLWKRDEMTLMEHVLCQPLLCRMLTCESHNPYLQSALHSNSWCTQSEDCSHYACISHPLLELATSMPWPLWCLPEFESRRCSSEENETWQVVCNYLFETGWIACTVQKQFDSRRLVYESDYQTSDPSKIRPDQFN